MPWQFTMANWLSDLRRCHTLEDSRGPESKDFGGTDISIMWGHWLMSRYECGLWSSPRHVWSIYNGFILWCPRYKMLHLKSSTIIHGFMPKLFHMLHLICTEKLPTQGMSPILQMKWLHHYNHCQTQCLEIANRFHTASPSSLALPHTGGDKIRVWIPACGEHWGLSWRMAHMLFFRKNMETN